jgi:conjugal transfer pilus assembly protein TraE
MAFAILGLVLQILTMHERIVLVPPVLEHKADVSWNSANEEYYKSVGLYFAVLIGNITPSNVNFVSKTLASLLDPEIYEQVKVKLKSYSEDLGMNSSNVVNFFSPKNVVFEKDTNKVFVNGTLTTTSSGGNPHFREVVYELSIEIRNGLPIITSLDSYEGTEGHTLEWIKSHPKNPVNDKTNVNGGA